MGRLTVSGGSNTMCLLMNTPLRTCGSAPTFEENPTMNPLDSLGGTVAAGFVLAIVLSYVAKALAGV